MAFIRLPLGIRVAMEFDLDGEPVFNIYHITTSDPITTVKLTSIAQLFIDWWSSDLKARISDEMSLISVTAHNYNEANGEKIYLPVSPAVPGGSASPSLPNNCALVVSHKTALTGRSYQGRTYLAGISESQVTRSYIDSAAAGLMVGVFLALDTDLTTANSALVVASFVSNQAPRAVGVATPVDSFGVSLRMDSQRRRLP